MLGQAFKYSYINAKVRTIYSKRLRKRDWAILRDAADKNSFVQYLSTTYYGAYLAEILKGPEKGLHFLERQIYRALFADYEKVIRALKPPEGQVFYGLFSRFEAENLKTLIRAKKTGLPKREVLHLLYPVETLSKINWHRLWKAGSLAEAIDLLSDTPFGTSVAHALPQFEAHGRLFPIEMAMEIASYRQIWEAVSALSSKKDRQMARMLIGGLVDALNIYHVARLRFIYILSTEETLNFTYPGGYILNLKRLHDISRATDMKSLVSYLPKPLKAILEGTDSLSQMRMVLQDWLLKRIKGVFLTLPLHLGVEIAWVIYREMEIEAILRIFETKGRKVKAGQVRLVPETLIQEE